MVVEPSDLLYLIEILHQTTTTSAVILWLFRLYLIEILHQTTTRSSQMMVSNRCILSKFYIKPQHNGRTTRRNRSCILSKFYIKPQPCFYSAFLFEVVSYRNSTSNHNWKSFIVCNLVVVSYRNSTSNHNLERLSRKSDTSCILSKFYIKPQLVRNYYSYSQVVSYRNSTSNHNRNGDTKPIKELYLIEILHQTTTLSMS